MMNKQQMNRNTEGSESAAARQVARVEALCRSYLTAMESGDLEALLSLFTENATATSPISGKQPVRDFYDLDGLWSDAVEIPVEDAANERKPSGA